MISKKLQITNLAIIFAVDLQSVLIHLIVYWHRHHTHNKARFKKYENFDRLNFNLHFDVKKIKSRTWCASCRENDYANLIIGSQCMSICRQCVCDFYLLVSCTFICYLWHYECRQWCGLKFLIQNQQVIPVLRTWRSLYESYPQNTCY